MAYPDGDIPEFVRRGGMFDFKNPFKSMTLWGVLLGLPALLEQLYQALTAAQPYVVDPRAQAVIVSALGIIGTILAILGRFNASKPLSFKAPLRDKKEK